MARGARALMRSLCAGRVLLQNTHSHKHISTLRAPSARVKGRRADRVLTSIAAARFGDPRRGETYQRAAADHLTSLASATHI